jgi:hypothetical protein
LIQSVYHAKLTHKFARERRLEVEQSKIGLRSVFIVALLALFACLTFAAVARAQEGGDVGNPESSPVFTAPVGTSPDSIACCLEVAQGTATVDGYYKDWDLEKTFVAEMKRTGWGNQSVKAYLYLQYDCDTDRLHVLVLSKDGAPVEENLAEAWIALGDRSQKLPFDEFTWVRGQEEAIGFEASVVDFPKGESTVWVHANVWECDESGSNCGWRPAETNWYGLCISVSCPPTAVIISSFSAVGVNIDSPTCRVFCLIVAVVVAVFFVAWFLGPWFERKMLRDR